MARGIRGWLYRGLRVLAGGAVALVLLSILQVLAVRWITPPATVTMLSRAWENGEWVDVRPLPLDELGSENESRCTARFSPDSRARPGDHIQVNVATEKMHFFDIATHLAIRL